MEDDILLQIMEFLAPRDRGLGVHCENDSLVRWATARLKEAGWNSIWDSPAGLTGVQTWVPTLFSEAVSKRGMRLERFVQLSSTAARIFGLYPRKGIITPGADADLVVFDPDVTWTATAR